MVFIVLCAIFISPVSGADISSKSIPATGVTATPPEKSIVRSDTGSANLKIRDTSSAQIKTDSTASLHKDALITPGSFSKPGPDSLHKTSTTLPPSGALSHEDSLAKTTVRDSLVLEKSKYLAKFKKFPVSIDSLYSPTHLRQPYLFTSDAIGLSEAMGRFQQVISVPFSLSSALNRFMMYGFPLPSPSLYSDESMLGENTSALEGSDRTSCTQISQVFLEPPLQLRYNLHPGELVTPETDILWEHGVFNENIFCVRFTRPLSSDLNVGVFSNNRLFSPLTYATRGDIKTFYNYFVQDTTLLSQGGKYPLVNEQNSGIRLVSKGKNGEHRYLSLSYKDQHNEESFEVKDSSGKNSLQWEEIFQYGAIADAGITGMHINPFFLNAESRLITEGNTLDIPVVNKEYLGRNNEYSLAVKPYLPVYADTLSASGTLTRHDQTIYDNSKPAALSVDGALSCIHRFPPWNGMDARVSGTVGQHYLKFDGGRHDHDWTWNINAKIEAPKGLLRVYSVRDFASYPIIYDTADRPFNVFFDSYEAHGAELFAWYKKIGITTGVCAISGLSGADSAEIWPHNVLPYQQPRLSYVASPLFGQWHGLSGASRWMFSDKRPYIKAQTSLSYQAHPLHGKEHILLDLVLDYWGARDTMTYGGRRDWNREIFNLSLRSAVQIKTFSLFYKIDNILNRNFAYVPGYRMPGITFRWGFQWLIQG